MIHVRIRDISDDVTGDVGPCRPCDVEPLVALVGRHAIYAGDDATFCDDPSTQITMLDGKVVFEILVDLS